MGNRIGAGLCGMLEMNFLERLSTFRCVVRVHILDDAQKRAEDGWRTPRH
jgi:hypothetical protein